MAATECTPASSFAHNPLVPQRGPEASLKGPRFIGAVIISAIAEEQARSISDPGFSLLKENK